MMLDFPDYAMDMCFYTMGDALDQRNAKDRLFQLDYIAYEPYIARAERDDTEVIDFIVFLVLKVEV